MNAASRTGVRTLSWALLSAAVLAPAIASEPAASPPEFLAAAADALAVAVVAERDLLEADRVRREALIDEFLRPKFDLETASRLILRSHWEAASSQGRQRFVEAFYRYLVASYGDALPQFTRETIQVLPGQVTAGGASSQVRARLMLTGGRRFDVDFYLRLDGRGWRIVDVIVEGISYIRTCRTDFGAEVRAAGLDSLIERLEDIASD